MSTTQTTTEGAAIMATKAAPPAVVSLATIAGYPVSELVLWATLVYTVLMIGHKLVQIYREVQGKGGRDHG
jgi:hypothetical protein